MQLSISKELRAVMLKQHVTIAELARRSKQTPQNLSNKLARDNFTVKELVRLADALNCTLSIRLLDNPESF